MFLIQIDDGTGYVDSIFAMTYDITQASTLNSGVFELTAYNINGTVRKFNVRIERITGWVTELEVLELTSGTGDLPKTRKISITVAQ